MSSVRARGNKCFTRTNKSGGQYVVCNDPPKGSRGQAGVYQADNPTGKQDGRSKRKKKEVDKQRAYNRVRKSMMTDVFQKNFGAGEGVATQRVPKKAPATSTMKRDLVSKGTDPKVLEGMGKLYIYTRWANETDRGKKFVKDNDDIEKPKKFERVDDREDIIEQAREILSGDLPKDEFKPKVIDDTPSKEEYNRWEKGDMRQDVREEFEERALRYKHYLELADRDVPDWVKDASR